MGSSSSRHRPQQDPQGAYQAFNQPPPGQQQHQQQWQQQYQQQQPPPQRPPPQQQQAPPGGYTNGQLYGGYLPPQRITPQQQPYWGNQYAQPPVAGPGQGAPRPVMTHEYQQTSTIKNQVNLKKASLKLVPLEGRSHEFDLRFTFDASAPCRVTTFLLATEEPANGCRVTSAVLGAPPRVPVPYPKGRDHKFPPESDPAAARAHVISSLAAPMGHMVLASGDSYPIIIRLETLMEDAWAQGHTLEELEVGGPFPAWAQAQTTYAKLKQGDDGTWQVVVMKQKIWVKGVSYELQEIYGMDTVTGKPVGDSQFDELEGGECVICMSSPRDTTVLPCRHMCMCRECASALKTQTNKCPICRNEIDSLLHIKINRKTPEPGEGS